MNKSNIKISALALFVPWLFADHAHNTFALYDLAVFANLFYRRPDFHGFSPKSRKFFIG